MGILFDFFIGDDAVAAAYDGSSLPAVDCASYTGFTFDVLGGLRGALTGDVALHNVDDFEMIHPADEDAECFAVRFPPEFVALLAEAEVAAFDRAVSEWGCDELGLDESDAADLVADVIRLAKRAHAKRKNLYAWNSP